MKKRLFWLNSVVLLVGLGIATRAVQVDYRLFSGGIGKNPAATPCLYGAIAFFIAFVWSVKIALAATETQRGRQVNLNWLLLASTIFAWSNFIPILVRFYCAAPGKVVIGCSALPLTNPWWTFCFGGAASFLLALIIGLVIVGRRRRVAAVPGPAAGRAQPQ